MLTDLIPLGRWLVATLRDVASALEDLMDLVEDRPEVECHMRHSPVGGGSSDGATWGPIGAGSLTL